MSDKNSHSSGSCLLEIITIATLIFFFWGEPDNWDKLSAIIDQKYSQDEQKPEKPNPL